jgi:VWFA-related protein
MKSSRPAGAEAPASTRRRGATALVLAALLAMGGTVPTAQQQQQQQQAPETPRFDTSTSVNIVSVDVIVRDANGNVVRGLSPKDFSVTEDGKPQQIETFSFQEIAEASAPEGAAGVELLTDLEQKLREEVKRAASATSGGATTADAPAPASLQNRRMIVLLFDTSSMQPENVQQAVESGLKYVEDDMGPADLVAVVTIGSRLNVLTDFTSSKEDVQAALQSLAYSDGLEIDPTSVAAVATAATEEAAATEGETTTEADAFEEFNNDVRLRALKTLCETVAPIQQKKAVLYFSAGMQRSGDDNQIELRAATNACNRGNVSLYPVDARGLQAMVGSGGATQRSSGGTALFSGQGALRGMQQINSSQGTLTTLAADTGGRAFTDSNNFGEAFARVNMDLAAYYLLGYSSTNPARDGKFRRIQVRVNRNDLRGLRIEARNGYYAGRSFAATNRRDREAQLDDQLAAAVSSTDMPMVVGTGFFRQTNDRFYVPIALAVPGFVVPVAEGAQKVSLDVKGEVRDEQGRTVARITRDTIEVPTNGAETLAGRQVFYQTGVSLPPGRFVAKLVVRENTGGAIGSFEAPIFVPQLNDATMKVSSVVMSTQVQKRDGRSDNPLVRDGVQLLPNLTRAVARNQKMYFYYEVYDPAVTAQAADVRTSLAFYRGNVKVFETPMVERTMVDEPNRRAVVFQFEVPAEQFKPGTYTCQINIIDGNASTVAFPRLQFAVMN